MGVGVEVWEQHHLFTGLAAILGLILGSFYTACVHRYLAGQTLTNPRRSACPACGATISWRDNIPILSYLLLGGRCRACRAPISLRYPVMEATSALWAASVAFVYGPGPEFLVFLFFGGVFIVASFIDFDSYILPDFLTLPGTAAALAASAFVLDVGWKGALLGAAVGGGTFLAVQRLYRALRGHEGLGTGDVKLMFLIGALRGPLAIPLVLTVGATSALAASLAYVLRPGGKGMQTAVPFGPFLCLGCMAEILFGRLVWGWYLQ